MMNRASSCLLLSIACVVSVGACASGGGVSKPDESTATAKLAGTSWTVEDVSGQAVIDKTQTALRFEADGRVSGSTGCNSYTGTATIKTRDLTFSPLATTRLACLPESMDQEQRLMKAMEAVRSYSVDSGGELQLLDANGNPLLRLSPSNPAGDRR